MEVSIIPLRRWPGMEEDSATLPVLCEIETEDFDLPMSVKSSILDLPPDPLFDKLDRYLQSDSFSDPYPLPAFAPPPDPKRARSCPDHAMLLPEFGGDVPRFAVGVGGVTAQSVAARERRKRISEKTGELGRLVPGGHRMSTAEMFQAAASYVRFLRAQVGMLSLLQVQQETCSALTKEGENQLQQLITSTPVQEKLYRAGRCIVPKRMVDALAADRTIKSHLSISRDLSRFRDSIKCNNSKPLDKKSSYDTH